MPNRMFKDSWEKLVFDEDLKGELLWTVTNFLQISRKPGYTRRMNPLVLLHGPPGTGKTTLCQGLAQKISIRLKSTYSTTKLIQIKTASLLSRYYSESAKQVEEIFDTIESICLREVKEFICVLIDEIEGIASSRSLGVTHGEAQDSLRATNALLSGLDRVRHYPNIIILSTSNMIDCLDTAFTDRCSIQFVGAPAFSSQYTILRNCFLKMMNQGVISYGMAECVNPKHIIPPFREANLYLVLNKDDPGTKLFNILQLQNSDGCSRSQGGISGRKLAQLLEQAIMRYLRDEECSLEMAFDFLKRIVVTERSREEKRMASETEVEG
ncbi:hypothetical protein B7463_g5121, partial [Scytalidium lignicola]